MDEFVFYHLFNVSHGRRARFNLVNGSQIVSPVTILPSGKFNSIPWGSTVMVAIFREFNQPNWGSLIFAISVCFAAATRLIGRFSGIVPLKDSDIDFGILFSYN